MEKAQEERLLEAIARLEARMEAMEKSEANADGGTPLAENLHDKINDLSEAITAYIEAHPVRSATIAFILGLVLASRRGGR